MTFENWWLDFSSEHEEWRYADSEALRKAAYEAGASSRDTEIHHLQMALADTEALELGTAEKCDQLREQVALLREYMQRLSCLGNGDRPGNSIGNRIAQEALAATPAQSLARIRNQVREECALEADRQSEDEPYGHAKFRCANIALEIRAMKEPE